MARQDILRADKDSQDFVTQTAGDEFAYLSGYDAKDQKVHDVCLQIAETTRNHPLR